MEIFIAVCNDRHIDIDVKVFTTVEAAIQYAKDFIQQNHTIGPVVEEQDNDWTYYATYGYEGDHVWVERGELET